MLKMISFVALLVAAQFLPVTAARAQGSYKVEPAPLPAAPEMPAPLASALESQGNRVLDSAGATVCEVWLGKSIPFQAGAGSGGDLLYATLQFGALVGALHFPNAGSDFRGQPIKPGYYTLRYALVPQDGNHMGVNPTRDFILMSLAAQDTQLDKLLKFDELVKMSKQASGTNHPAILAMSGARSGAVAKSASLTSDDQNDWILQAPAEGKNSAGQAQSLPLAIIVVGKAPATE